MAYGFKTKAYYWAMPKSLNAKSFCPTSPTIVLVTTGEKKIYSVASGHFFYVNDFEFGESPEPLEIPSEFVKIIENNPLQDI
ncbi:hypothetical protein NVP1081O_223 [Vibrio phage 1.081.O._10N.286.52.C2]|nr:hypothetical protein NVP1081O_223 [Vibrio phage 1.081.O._10N.286.52.C2]